MTYDILDGYIAHATPPGPAPAVEGSPAFVAFARHMAQAGESVLRLDPRGLAAAREAIDRDQPWIWLAYDPEALAATGTDVAAFAALLFKRFDVFAWRNGRVPLAGPGDLTGAQDIILAPPVKRRVEPRSQRTS